VTQKSHIQETETQRPGKCAKSFPALLGEPNNHRKMSNRWWKHNEWHIFQNWL